MCGSCLIQPDLNRLALRDRIDLVFSDAPYGISIVNPLGKVSSGLPVGGANHFSDAFPASSCWIVWDKDNGQSFFADAELAYCSAKSSVRIFKHQWNGLLKASERGQKRCHPTQKPIALAAWCIETYGEKAETIFDPFSGSAPVLLACEQLNRRCRAMEISPAYVAVSLQRWADLTGNVPKLSRLP